MTSDGLTIATTSKVKIGDKFNMLTVVEQCEDYIEPNGKRRAMFLCECECGNTRKVRAQELYTDKVYSCGCTTRPFERKSPNRIHGETKTRLHNIWVGMKTRCYIKNHHSYKYYGARGIVVCDEWKNDYIAFATWARNNGYKDNLSLDRIDVNGNYTPENCRWTDRKTQANNKRNNVYLTVNGETHTRTEWAKKMGISESIIFVRQQKGWSDEKAVLTPVEDNTHYITINGETHSCGEWERIKGLGCGTINTRIRRGWNEVEAVTYPKILGKSKRLQNK